MNSFRYQQLEIYQHRSVAERHVEDGAANAMMANTSV
jgi:hypothetical protein